MKSCEEASDIVQINYEAFFTYYLYQVNLKMYSSHENKKALSLFYHKKYF